MRASKQVWLEAVLAVAGDKATEHEKKQFASMSRAQLVAVEFLVVAMRDDACQVGCGDCEYCAAHNEAAQAAIDKANPMVGRLVTVLPMTVESRRWVAKNKAKRSKMIKRAAERFTVRAPNGRQRTFGPHDATWSAVHS